MADYGVAFLAVGVVVGAVMLLVALTAFVGVRFSGRPPSTALSRRIATSLLVVGAIWLVFVPIAFIYGGGFVWIIGAFEGPLLIAVGWMQLRATDSGQSGDV